MNINKNLEDVICEKISRGYITSGKNKEDSTSMIRVINYKDLSDGRIRSDAEEKIGVPEDTDLSRYTLKPGDVVLTLKSPFKAALITEAEKGSIASQNMVTMTPNSDILFPELFVEYLNGDQGQKQIANIASGSIILSIPVSALKTLKIPVPPREVQVKIRDYLSSSYLYLGSLETEIKSLIEIRSGVIRRYLI